MSAQGSAAGHAPIPSISSILGADYDIPEEVSFDALRCAILEDVDHEALAIVSELEKRQEQADEVMRRREDELDKLERKLQSHRCFQRKVELKSLECLEQMVADRTAMQDMQVYLSSQGADGQAGGDVAEMMRQVAARAAYLDKREMRLDEKEDQIEKREQNLEDKVLEYAQKTLRLLREGELGGGGKNNTRKVNALDEFQCAIDDLNEIRELATQESKEMESALAEEDNGTIARMQEQTLQYLKQLSGEFRDLRNSGGEPVEEEEEGDDEDDADYMAE